MLALVPKQDTKECTLKTAPDKPNTRPGIDRQAGGSAKKKLTRVNARNRTVDLYR